MVARKFDALLGTLVSAMPNAFDAHQAQTWYRTNYPAEFGDDLSRYKGDEHVLARELSKAIDRRSDVRQRGKSQPSTNLRGRQSTCTVWEKILTMAASS